MISYSFLKRCSFLFLDFLFIQLVESQPGVTILSVRNYWQVEALSLSQGGRFVLRRIFNRRRSREFSHPLRNACVEGPQRSSAQRARAAAFNVA